MIAKVAHCIFDWRGGNKGSQCATKLSSIHIGFGINAVGQRLDVHIEALLDLQHQMAM